MVRPLLIPILAAGAAATTALHSRSSAAAVDCTGVNAISPKCQSNEAKHTRDVFYVGSRLVPTTSGNITADQLYVEKLTPACGVRHEHPLVFFHGGAVSGVTWLNTPDGRQGLASYFLARGYQVYLMDHTGVGRSSQEDSAEYVLWNSTTQESVQSGFTAPELYNKYPQASLHTQWPGTGQVGDPYFDQFRKGIIPFTTNYTMGELSMRASGCELLELVGPAYLVSHSSGAQYPILLSDECPDSIAGNINLEQTTQPFYNYGNGAGSGSSFRPWGLANTPLTYDPPASSSDDLNKVWVGNDTDALRACYLQEEPARQLTQIAKVPYFAVTGEASVHATYDHCTINFLNQAGVQTEWIKLADIDITGNGHFGFLEKNSHEIANVLEQWIEFQDAQ